MYLWVVLATFITILYSYNLPIRADMDRVHAETKASVVVAKFRAQHNAIKEYLNSQAPDKTGQTRVTYFPGDGFNSTTGADLADGGNAEGSTNYRGEVEKYLPVGYQPDDLTVSKVFCLKEGQINESQCTSGGDGSCCSNEYMGVYVVSFREIPSRWINKITNMPNADLLGALSQAGGYGSSIGYTETIGNKLVLSGGRVTNASTTMDPDGTPVENKTFEYREIFNAVKSDADFVDKKCNDEKVHCLFAIQQIYS